MISIHQISKRFRVKKGYKIVLDGVSMDFPPGVNVGILGRNGAGKTVLLKIISGVERPDSGWVQRGASVSWPVGSGGLQGSLTGRANIRFVSRLYGLDFDEVIAYVSDFTELGHYLDMPVNTYSSGMKGKLNFALSMAVKFDYYLIDEATAKGDHSFQKKSKAEFEKLKGSSSLIMVSHNPGNIKQHCDVAAILHNGHLTYYDQVPEAIDIYSRL